jgi:tetratricopeptide (TPR) repeat protein
MQSHAVLDDRQSARVALHHAESLTDRLQGEPVWPWIFAFDQRKLARHQARALANLGDNEAASAAFGQVDLDLLGPKTRALTLLDYARVSIAQGDPDKGVAFALQALSLGSALDSGRIEAV